MRTRKCTFRHAKAWQVETRFQSPLRRDICWLLCWTLNAPTNIFLIHTLILTVTYLPHLRLYISSSLSINLQTNFFFNLQSNSSAFDSMWFKIVQSHLFIKVGPCHATSANHIRKLYFVCCLVSEPFRTIWDWSKCRTEPLEPMYIGSVWFSYFCGLVSVWTSFKLNHGNTNYGSHLHSPWMLNDQKSMAYLARYMFPPAFFCDFTVHYTVPSRTQIGVLNWVIDPASNSHQFLTVKDRSLTEF